MEPTTDAMTALRGGLARVEQGLDVIPAGVLVEPDEIGAEALGDLVERVSAATSRLGELRLRLLRLAEESDAGRDSAASSVDEWLARLTGSTRARMRGGLWLARMLQTRYRHVLAACAAGELDEERARVIVKAAERMPACVGDADRAEAERQLVERAVRERLDPARLRRVARRMCEAFSPDVADTHEADMLGEEEKSAAATAWFALDDNGDGTMSGRFMIPEMQGRMLLTILEHLSAPRRMGRDGGGKTTIDETVPPWGYRERMGAAFVELIDHLPTDGLASHGRVGATVMIHLDYTHLLDGLAAAHTDCGADVSAATVRRMACNAGLIPAVFGTESVPLDLGRETRLHTKGQRAALSAQYDCCAAEGCQRPFAWCEIHHPQAWLDGGRTDLTNALPLCGWHHRRVHDPLYEHERLPNGRIRFHRRRVRTRVRAAA